MFELRQFPVVGEQGEYVVGEEDDADDDELYEALHLSFESGRLWRK